MLVCNADLFGGVSLEKVDPLVPLRHVVWVLPQHDSTQQRRPPQRQGLHATAADITHTNQEKACVKDVS